MQKKIRIKDIAEMAGVSPGTVDRVLHNRGNVSEPARVAVEKVLEKVNYKPNIHISGLSLKRNYKVAITTPEVFKGEYWESIHNGIKRALNEYENIKIEYFIHTYDQYNVNSCKKVFQTIAALETDAVIIGPTFKAETSELCNRLNEKEIPFIFVDSNMEELPSLAFFSSDHFACGRLMCKLITSITPPESEIGILRATRIGDESANTTVLRRQGFADYLNEKQCKNRIVKIPFSATEPEKNKHLLSVFFEKNRNVKGVVVLNSKGFLIADYLYKHNLKDIRLVGVDLTEPNVHALKAEHIDFLIGQRPETQGFLAMKTLIEYLIFRQPVAQENYVPLDITTKETIDYYNSFNHLL